MENGSLDLQWKKQKIEKMPVEMRCISVGFLLRIMLSNVLKKNGTAFAVVCYKSKIT